MTSTTGPTTVTAPGSTPLAPPVSIVLAGARGHGRWHVENIRRLQDKGLVRLAGICELTPLTEEEFGGELPAQSPDFGALLDSTGAQVAVICTPIPTHTDLALAAAQRGVHLLLEKPPAPSYAEFRRMADGVAAAGVVCQIGFQSLGSHAVPAVRELIEKGVIGTLTGVGGAGAWARDEAYYRRAPWAGKRRLNGVDVIDGALTNPSRTPSPPPSPSTTRPAPRTSSASRRNSCAPTTSSPTTPPASASPPSRAGRSPSP